METQLNEIWIALVPLIVPYLTAGIKRVWLFAMSSMPRWLGPIKAVVAGWILTAISTKIGVPLPSDLANLTESTVTGILVSGFVLGAVGSWIRDFFHGLKKDYGSDTVTGKAVRSISGG